MDNILKFLQINLHKSKTATSELAKRLDEFQGNIALLTEPWLDKAGKIRGLPGCLLFSAPNSVNPRAAICIPLKAKFNCWEVHEFTDRDISTVCLQHNNTELYIASVYIWISQYQKLMKS